MLKGIKRLVAGERRRHERLHGGVSITVGEEEAEVVDWSTGGFRIVMPPDADFERGSVFDGRVRVGDVSGPYTARITSMYSDGSVGARFESLDPGVLRALVAQL